MDPDHSLLTQRGLPSPPWQKTQKDDSGAAEAAILVRAGTPCCRAPPLPPEVTAIPAPVCTRVAAPVPLQVLFFSWKPPLWTPWGYTQLCGTLFLQFSPWTPLCKVGTRWGAGGTTVSVPTPTMTAVPDSSSTHSTAPGHLHLEAPCTSESACAGLSSAPCLAPSRWVCSRALQLLLLNFSVMSNSLRPHGL